uniref:Uncharacterized protein n=1 Tax=Parazoarcus communis TaxID=41977 RepID=Q1KY58_9RHOO|nr:hypothetical protein [Parazoarcus communis]
MDALDRRANTIRQVDRIQDDGELVTTQAGDGVGTAGTALGTGGKFADDRVAGTVAAGVVDLLETVHVDHQYAHPARLLRQVDQAAAQPVHEQRPVGQARQVVVGRLVHQIAVVVVRGMVHGGRHQTGQQLEQFDVVVGKVCRRCRHGFQHADGRFVVLQGHDDHGPDTYLAAGLTISARVGFGVVAAQDLAGLSAQPRQAGVALEADAEMAIGHAGGCPVDHVVAFGQFDGHAVGANQAERPFGDPLHDVTEIAAQLRNLGLYIDDLKQLLLGRHDLAH